MATITIKSPLIAALKPSKKGSPVAVDKPAPEYTPPTPTERMHNAAHNARVNATQDWVEGRISTKKHTQIHARAARVLKGKI